MYDYSFNGATLIDSVAEQSAYYYSVYSDKPEENFPHGPPSPSGSKYSLILTPDNYFVVPTVVDKNTMTIRFWLFITTVTPDDHWKSLFWTREVGSDSQSLEVKLWPTLNRLQIHIKTDLGVETIDTIASLLPRRWYNIAITTINDKNKVNIYINGLLDGNSMVLKGNRETTRQVSDYILGRSSDLKGVNAYVDRFQIYSKELDPVLLMPAYTFMQSTKDPFIVHGCQSCKYDEAALV